MSRCHVFITSTAICMAFVSGCANMNGAQFDLSSFIAAQRAPGQFKEAVLRKDWSTANQLYGNFGKQIDTDQMAAVSEVVQQINAEWSTRLEAKRLEIAEQAARSDTTPLQLQASMAAAKEILASYRSNAVFNGDPSRMCAEATSLELAITPDVTRSFLLRQFAAYEHAKQAPFFNDLDSSWATSAIRSSVVSANSALIVKAIASAPGPKAAELFAAYAEDLDPEGRKTARQAYFAKLAMRGRLQLADVVEISNAMQVAGASASDDVLALFQVRTSATEITPTLGDRIFNKVSMESLMSEIDKATIGGVPYVLIAASPQGAQIVTLSDAKTSTIKVKTGMAQTSNPAYAEAQDRVIKAENDYRSAQTSNRQLQSQARQLASQSSGMLGAFGAAFGSISGSILEGSSMTELQNARQLLASTPRTISKPIYEERQVLAATETTQNVAQANLYLVDTKSKIFSSAEQRVESQSSRQIQGEAVTSALAEQARSYQGPSTLQLNTTELSQKLSAEQRPLKELLTTLHTDQQSFERSTAQMQATAAKTNASVKEQTTRLAQSAGDQGSTVSQARSSAGAGGCQKTLAFLRSKLPTGTHPMIQEVIDKALSEDLMAAMREANRQGATHTAAVNTTFAQADEMDNMVKQALATASAVDAFGTSDDEFMAQLKAGRLSAQNCDGIHNSAICAAIVGKVGAIATRAAGAEMACHDRSGTWPS